MKAHNIIPFTKWLLKKMFGGVGRIYGKYDQMIVDNTLLAFLPTMVMAMGSIVLILITLLIFKIDIRVAFPTWMIVSFIIFANYFRIVLRELYNDFKKERQELFNMLKD